MRPQPARLVARRQPEARAEIEQDVGGLADDELAGLEERRRERRARDARAVDELHHRRHAALAAPARHVDIVGAGLFQRQAHELAAPLDRRPVVELVAHLSAPMDATALAPLPTLQDPCRSCLRRLAPSERSRAASDGGGDGADFAGIDCAPAKTEETMPIANVRGANINYEVLGTSGPWVALSPGGRRALDNVKSLARHVADAGYRVLIHDRRNCGVSDIVIGGDQSEYEIWADDLHELLVAAQGAARDRRRQLVGLPAVGAVCVEISAGGARAAAVARHRRRVRRRAPHRELLRQVYPGGAGGRHGRRSARSITSRSASRRARKTARP